MYVLVTYVVANKKLFLYCFAHPLSFNPSRLQIPPENNVSGCKRPWSLFLTVNLFPNHLQAIIAASTRYARSLIRHVFIHRHIPRMNEEERGSETGADSGCAPDERSHNKKFTFKKRSTSSTGAHVRLEYYFILCQPL